MDDTLKHSSKFQPEETAPLTAGPTKRALLKALAAASTVGFARRTPLLAVLAGSSPVAAASPSSKTDLHRFLLSYDASKTIAASKNAAETVARLALAYDQRNKSASEIKGIISAQNPMQNPVTLQAMSNLFRESRQDADSPMSVENNADGPLDMDDLAKWIGKGFESAAVIGSAFAPEAAIPLGLLGVWGESGLKYLATPGLNLATNPFPATPPSRTEAMIQAGLIPLFSAADGNGKLQSVLTSPDVTRIVNLDYGAKDADLEKQLPADLQQLAAEASPSDKALVEKLKADMKAAYQDFANKMEGLTTQLKDQQQDAAVRQQQLQERASTDATFAGAINIAGFIAGRVLKDPDAARVITEGGNALRQGFNLISQFAVGEIGLVALSGGLLGAANILMSVLSPSDPVMDALKSISMQLKDIRDELTVIEKKENEILNKLSELYDAIQVSKDLASSHYRDTKQLIEHNFSETQADARDADFSNRVTARTNDAITILASDRRDPQWQLQYSLCLTDIYTFATSNTTNTHYTGDPDGVSSINVDLEQQPSADLHFGVIPNLLVAAGVGHDSPYSPPSLAEPAVPNPVAWGQATRRYLELRAKAMEVKQPNEIHELQGMWTQGLRIREAAQQISSPETLAVFAKLYCQSAGLPDPDAAKPADGAQAVASSGVLGQWGKVVDDCLGKLSFTSDYSLQDFGGNYKEFDGPTYRSDNSQGLSHHHYHAVNDPLEFGLRQGFIRLDSDETTTPDQRSIHKIIIAQGPRTGEELLPGLRMTSDFFQFIYGTTHFRIRGFLVDVGSLVDGPGLDIPKLGIQGGMRTADLDNVMSQIFDAVKRWYEWPLITQAVVKPLLDKIDQGQNDEPYKSFFQMGGISRLAATIAKWRRTSDSVESRKAAHLDNANIPSTFESYKEIFPFVFDPARLPALKTNLATFTPPISIIPRPRIPQDWSAFVKAVLANTIQITSDTIENAAKGLTPEQGIPEVDETLKMLGGFMRLRNISTSPIYPPMPTVTMQPRTRRGFLQRPQEQRLRAG